MSGDYTFKELEDLAAEACARATLARRREDFEEIIRCGQALAQIGEKMKSAALSVKANLEEIEL